MTSKINNKTNREIENEVDIELFLSGIKRNRKILYKFIFISFIFSISYSFIKRPTWEGEFEIVLSDMPTRNFNYLDIQERDRYGTQQISPIIATNNEKTSTEVKILESPSVLNPVYEYVKNKYKEKNINVKNLTFKKWKEKKLRINLRKNTKVLNVKYQEGNKGMIIPVINKISEKYIWFSGKERRESLDNSLNYIEDQINLYKKRSKLSQSKAQEFSLKNDLSSAFENDISANNQEISSVKIENDRINAKNELRNINYLLEQLESNENSYVMVQYLSKNIPEVSTTTIRNELDKIEIKLANLRTNYQETDQVITRTLEKQNILVKSLEKLTRIYLTGKKIGLKAKIIESERPKDIIIQYRELLREARRNNLTLATLEKERHLINLEKAIYKKPWKLITKPTVLDKPIRPRKLRIIILGTWLGLILGILFTTIKDKYKSILYEFKEFKDLIPFEFIKTIRVKEIKNINEDLFLVSSKIKENYKGNLGIMILGAKPAKEIKELTEAIKSNIKDREVIISNNYKEIKSINLILIVAVGSLITKYELEREIEKVKLLNKELIGWIYIDTE